jgi:hypothetical protein
MVKTLESRLFRDAKPSDLRHAIDHMSIMFRECVLKSDKIPYSADEINDLKINPLSLYDSDWRVDWSFRAHKVKGVRVKCVEDGELEFSPVEFPRDHPFIRDTARMPPCRFKNVHTGLQVPGAVEISLSWFRNTFDANLELNPSTKNLKQSVSDLRDCLVVELIMEHRQLGPQETFDMTFVRGDLKDLYVEHMQALCGFCTDKMLPLLDGCVTRAQYVAIATKQHFESYFQHYKERYGWDENLMSAYEVPTFGGFNDMSTTPLASIEGPLDPLRRCSCKQNPERPCCHLLTLALKERNRFLLPEAFLRMGGAAHFAHSHQN